MVLWGLCVVYASCYGVRVCVVVLVVECMYPCVCVCVCSRGRVCACVCGVCFCHSVSDTNTKILNESKHFHNVKVKYTRHDVTLGAVSSASSDCDCTELLLRR